MLASGASNQQFLVINLLTKALSPNPTKQPPISEMLAELNVMNECLLEIETRGVISAAAAAAVAGGGPSRMASTDTGEAAVTYDNGAAHPPPPVPDTLEAVSGALEGRGSAVPDQVAAVARVNIIILAVIPAVTVSPVVSRETADGSAAAKEGRGGGRSALAPSAAPATDGQRSTASRPIPGGSVPVLRVVSGGLPSHDGLSGGGNHVVQVARTVCSERSCYRGICGDDAGVCWCGRRGGGNVGGGSGRRKGSGGQP
ncbi:unnamed protein product, partial [Ectocarpus sp. 13 AM-2016]